MFLRDKYVIITRHKVVITTFKLYKEPSLYGPLHIKIVEDLALKILGLPNKSIRQIKALGRWRRKIYSVALKVYHVSQFTSAS